MCKNNCLIPKNKYKLSIESTYFPRFPKWSLRGENARLVISPLQYIKASPAPVFRSNPRDFLPVKYDRSTHFIRSTSVCFHGSTAGFLRHHESHELTVEFLNLLHVLCLVCSVQQTLQDKVPNIRFHFNWFYLVHSCYAFVLGTHKTRRALKCSFVTRRQHQHIYPVSKHTHICVYFSASP